MQRIPRYLMLGLWLMLALSACQTDSRTKLQVEDLRLIQRPGGSRYVQGVLYNPGDKPVAYAEIEISLFDGRNQKVGTLRIPVKDIPPHGRKSFRKVIDSDADVQGARVRRILAL